MSSSGSSGDIVNVLELSFTDINSGLTFLGKMAGAKNNIFEKPSLANKEKVAKLKQKATAMLKSTFGGNISDSERETILANFGLNKDTMSYQEFNTAVKLLRDYFANELNKNKEILKLQNSNNGDTYNLGL